MWDKLEALSKTVADSDAWLIQVFALVLLILVIDLTLKVTLGRLLKRAKKTQNLWDESFIWSLKSPLRLLVWVIGIVYTLEVLHYRIPNLVIFNALPIIRTVSTIVIVTWFLCRFVQKVEDALAKKNAHNKTGLDKTFIHAIGKLTRAAILITGTLVLLQTLGVGISGVLAFGGIGGLAVSFAARDMLSNFFGGLMLYLDRPFKIGEWIRSPDKNIEGVVEHIGWRLTRIRTFDKRVLFVPNSVFSTISVENPSRMTNRRIRTVVGLRYDDAAKLADIIQATEKMLRQHPEIDTNLVLFVRFIEYGPSSLNFLIYTFTKTTDWVTFQSVQQDVLLRVLDIVNDFDAQVAFPTTTIHIPDNIHCRTLQGEPNHVHS